MESKPTFPWYGIICLGAVILAGIYIFAAEGFSLSTLLTFLGWVVGGAGFVFLLSGKWKKGIIALLAGIILSNILH